MGTKRKLTEFGIQVKQRLIAIGMNQKDFATKEVGITEQYLIDILYGGRYAEDKKKEINGKLDELESNMKL